MHTSARVAAVGLAAAGIVYAVQPLYLTGTVTNTTNEGQPVTAEAVMALAPDKSCVLRIGAPLYGSGLCGIESFDEKTGAIQLVSTGPLISIRCSGSLKGDVISGIFRVEYRGVPSLPEHGIFELSLRDRLDDPPVLAEVLRSDVVKSGESEYLLWLERNIVSVHQKDGTYAGRRILLDKDFKPFLVIDDYANGSIYHLPDKTDPILQWHTDGKTGYYVQPVGSTKRYLDRFFQFTGWSSFEFESQVIFAHEFGDGIELFDNSLKPLGIKSGKTNSGQVYWMVTRDEITEYLNNSFNSLKWYSFDREGQTYFAQMDRKNKVKLYDSNLKEIRLPKKGGFWASFARGVATGLVAYGQAVQARQAAAARSSGGDGVPTYGYGSYGSHQTTYSQNTTTMSPSSSIAFSNTYSSTGNSYSTTTQRLGSFVYSNTVGTDGYHSSSTTQRIGNFDYTTGSSTSGPFSGTRNRIGNFDFSNMTTPSGPWSGTSNTIGNFTFHNFTGPRGQMLSGTSTRIGNFIFTNIQ